MLQVVQQWWVVACEGRVPVIDTALGVVVELEKAVALCKDLYEYSV
jgi:hypothetical protein